MYVCEMTGAKKHINNYMVSLCSKLFCIKDFSGFLRQGWWSSYSLGKIQNEGRKKTFSVSLKKNSLFKFHLYFSASFALYLLVSHTHTHIYIYVYIYILYIYKYKYHIHIYIYNKYICLSISSNNIFQLIVLDAEKQSNRYNWL